VQIPLLSFFTGGGFLDIGFSRAGFKVVWTNEINETFAAMYEYGMTTLCKSQDRYKFMKRICDRRSIETITAQDVLEAAFPGDRPQLFGIIGGLHVLILVMVEEIKDAEATKGDYHKSS
jgi:DNA (cytosine-5)-methyltransferase 1